MNNNIVICTICAERYRNSDNIHVGSCGHAFHEECLFRWREQSRTCPICRCGDAAYFQLYLGFENEGASGSGNGGGGGPNQSQDCSSSSSPNANNIASNNNNSTSNSNSNSNSNNNSAINNSNSDSETTYEEIMREYNNLLYEKGLYQEEIEYLNECIGELTLRNSELKYRLEGDDSDTD